MVVIFDALKISYSNDLKLYRPRAAKNVEVLVIEEERHLLKCCPERLK